MLLNSSNLLVLGNYIEKLKPLPWNFLAYILVVSFTLSSFASTLLGHFILKKLRTESARSLSLPTEGGGFQESDFDRQTLSAPDIQALIARNIFNSAGEAENLTGTSTKKTNEPQKTTLPIKLVGLIYGGAPDNGIAVIENTQKHAVNSFMVGDAIVNEATLLEIHEDRVILLNQGNREFAILDESEIRRSTRKKSKSRSSGQKSLAGIDAYATEAPPESFKEEGFERKGSDIEMTSDYKNRLLSVDFAQVLQDAKANPNIVDGQIKGFKIDRIRMNSIYEKAGLRNGDVGLEINGVGLTDAGQAIKLMQSLRNEPELEMMVDRGGSKQSISIKVK